MPKLAEIFETVFRNTAQPGSGRLDGFDPTRQPEAISSAQGGLTSFLNDLAIGPAKRSYSGPLGVRVDEGRDESGTGFTTGGQIELGANAPPERLPHEIGHVVQSRLNPIGTFLQSLVPSVNAAGAETGTEASAGAQSLSALIRAAERGDEDAKAAIENMSSSDIEGALAYGNRQGAPTLGDALFRPGSQSYILRNK